MPELDPRLVEVDIEVNGQIKTYRDLFISAKGTKYANALQNEAEIIIYNLDQATQDYILTQTSPYTLNRTPKILKVRAGRQSYGLSQIYVGNIVEGRLSQPPDVALSLKCLTGNFQKGNILTKGMPASVSLFQVSKQLAQDLDVVLQFQASNRNISNFYYSGAALQQIASLNAVGGINVFLDDNTLVVKDLGVPLTDTLRVLDASSGMIGIPELTERGIKVKFLLDNKTILGGALQVTSALYPAVNGVYAIYKLSFDISNRDTPFYWIAEGSQRVFRT